MDNNVNLGGVTEIAGWNTAHEGDTVTVTASSGTIRSVTNNGSALLQDANGNYYLVVPRGGGVFLMVDLQLAPMVLFTSEAFEGPNGEELIFRVFEDGSFVLAADGAAVLCGLLLTRDGELLLRANTGAEFAFENGSVEVEAKGASCTLSFGEESVTALKTLALKA